MMNQTKILNSINYTIIKEKNGKNLSMINNCKKIELNM